MSFFQKLFAGDSSKIECPRCLGKGHVNDEDIKRLKKELKWEPGSCAYCNGTGKVKADLPSKLPVDTTYLSTSIPGKEAIKLQKGDQDALDRAAMFEVEMDTMISKIRYLYFEEKRSVQEIGRYFFDQNPAVFTDEKFRYDVVEHIKKVIEHYRR